MVYQTPYAFRQPIPLVTGALVLVAIQWIELDAAAHPPGIIEIPSAAWEWARNGIITATTIDPVIAPTDIIGATIADGAPSRSSTTKARSAGFTVADNRN